MAKGVPVGVIGHSGGAFLAYDAALTKSQAFVHMGSTLNSKGRCGGRFRLDEDGREREGAPRRPGIA